MEKADASLTNLQARELRDTLRQLEARRIQAILTDSYELRDGVWQAVWSQVTATKSR